MEQWIVSKLLYGNTYVLKQRDARGIVTALYILDAQRVTPLVAEDGSVYYKLAADHLSQLTDAITVPASEIIHDTHGLPLAPARRRVADLCLRNVRDDGQPHSGQQHQVFRQHEPPVRCSHRARHNRRRNRRAAQSGVGAKLRRQPTSGGSLSWATASSTRP